MSNKLQLAAATLLLYMAIAITIITLWHCATLPPDPTPEHPLIGCIMPTLQQVSHSAGQPRPEVVKVIGETPIDDGKRWIVLRGPNFDPKKWEPHSKEEIVFGPRCGPEVDAFRNLFNASSGDMDAAERQRIPPRK